MINPLSVSRPRQPSSLSWWMADFPPPVRQNRDIYEQELWHDGAGDETVGGGAY